LFQSIGFKKCAIITSYIPNVKDIKGEATGEDTETENIEKYETYKKMLNGKSVENFEEEVKKQFVEDPAQMKLLIVVDKLLTGFDAPPATYLYIDKNMKDHGLFQAICRVNRLDGNDKEYGYIIDYKDLFKSLEKSVKDYTSEAFGDYDQDDVDGLLKDRLKLSKERLDLAYESLKALCEPIDKSKGELAYIRYFVAKDTLDKDAIKENEQKRLELYKLVVAFIRAYASIADEMEEAGYTAKEIQEIKDATKFYDNIRSIVMHAAGDFIDLKAYEGDMRHLIDSYISASDSKKISEFDDMTLVDIIVARGEDAINTLPEGIKKNKDAVAETIENNVRKLIVDETPTNPKYYEKMSVLLDELIKMRKEKVNEYEKYLKEIIELTKKVKNPGASNEYPKKINTGAKRALYDNMEHNEELVIAIDEDIRNSKPEGFRGNKIKERKVKYTIGKYIKNEEKLNEIFEIVKKQSEY
ncbi:MAG: restriction endonuclease subunit R, partial [Sedimentibacter sp.]|uniref:type I restriction enzyme subunit R domain-containing protein n=1 Tax=Sedimentibacter sp. TaxID=1960295 RepID=UPI002987552F|nr:restriction endonuclease subunit R [Sedimentibacter sp.]